MNLSNQQIIVIKLRDEGKTLKEIGGMLGLSAERVRQIESKGRHIVRMEEKK